jgi:hypothetical protein
MTRDKLLRNKLVREQNLRLLDPPKARILAPSNLLAPATEQEFAAA